METTEPPTEATELLDSPYAGSEHERALKPLFKFRAPLPATKVWRRMGEIDTLQFIPVWTPSYDIRFMQELHDSSQSNSFTAMFRRFMKRVDRMPSIREKVDEILHHVHVVAHSIGFIVEAEDELKELLDFWFTHVIVPADVSDVLVAVDVTRCAVGLHGSRGIYVDNPL